MKLVPLRFLKSAPGGKYNAGEIGGWPESGVPTLLKTGIAELYEAPKPEAESEPQPEAEPKPETEKPKKRPRAFSRLDRSLDSPEKKRG